MSIERHGGIGRNGAGRPTRRDFIRRSGLAMGAMALGPAALAACGGDDGNGEGGNGGGGGGARELYFSNWTAYIDEETVDLFQRETGISLRYEEDYNDNNEYFARIQPELSAGRTIEPDLIAPTYWMAARLAGLDWLDPLPMDRIPNAANLRSDLATPSWDPEQQYNLPWQAGFAGIAYNREVTGRDLTSLDDLWDPAFANKVGILTEWRDTLGLIAMAEGIDIANPTADSLQPALDKLGEQVESGQVRRFHGNDYMADLANGTFAACIGWSGDIAQLQRDNPNLRFVIPESGGTVWYDTMVMPKGTQNVDAVAEWCNYVYDVKNAARIAAYVEYYSPVEGVQDELRALGEDGAAVADNPLVFPDEEQSRRLQQFGALSEEDEERIDQRFSQLQGN